MWNSLSISSFSKHICPHRHLPESLLFSASAIEAAILYVPVLQINLTGHTVCGVLNSFLTFDVHIITQ